VGLLATGKFPAASTAKNQAFVTIKGNAQALKTFSYQERMQLQLKGETKKQASLKQATFSNYQRSQ